MNKKSKTTLLSRLACFFLDIQAAEKADATSSGNVYIVFTLADGNEVYVDKDGFATLDDEQLPAGEHPLSDGNILVVDEDGQMIETIESSAKSSDPQQTTAPESLQTSDTDPQKSKESISALKNKIADLETKLSELATLAKEANSEIQNLRRQTPSSRPMPATGNKRKLAEMKRYEQMAQALSLSIKHKQNK